MICSKCGLDKTLLHKEQCEECLCDTVTEQAEQITFVRESRDIWKSKHEQQAKQIRLMEIGLADKDAEYEQQAEQIEHYRNAFNDEAKMCADREATIAQQAEQIAELKRHRHLVNEECQGYVLLNDGLQAENQQQAEQITALQCNYLSLDTSYSKAITENQRLKEYTYHRPTCKWHQFSYDMERQCTCGLEQALAAQPQKGDKEDEDNDNPQH